jgi:hypothetical protein
VSRIRELYWRADREEHILERHNVTREEVEEAVFGDPRGRLRRYLDGGAAVYRAGGSDATDGQGHDQDREEEQV